MFLREQPAIHCDNYYHEFIKYENKPIKSSFERREKYGKS